MTRAGLGQNPRAVLVVAVLAVALAACGGTGTPAAVAPPSAGEPAATTVIAPIVDATTTTAPPPTTTTTSTTTTTTTTTQPSLEPFGMDWFEVELIVIESQCFRSAGALVRVEPKLWVQATAHGVAPEDLVVERNYRVTYEIHGGEVVDLFSLTLFGPEMEVESRPSHSVSTESCSYELTAEVIRVDEVD